MTFEEVLMGVCGTRPSFSPVSFFTFPLLCLAPLWVHRSSSPSKLRVICCMRADSTLTERSTLPNKGFSTCLEFEFLDPRLSCLITRFWSLANLPVLSRFCRSAVERQSVHYLHNQLEIGHHCAGGHASNSLQKSPHFGKYGRKTLNIVQCHNWSIFHLGEQRCQIFLLQWISYVCVWSD